MPTERLETIVTLTVGKTAHVSRGGEVKAFSLEMTSHGLAGFVEIVKTDDKARGGSTKDDLFADFVKPDLTEVVIEIKPARWDASSTTTFPVIKTGGLVTEKSMTELTFEPSVKDPAVLARRYRLEFADPARVLFGQHFPFALYTKKSFKDVIAAQGIAKVTLDSTWDVANAAAPLLFLNLEARWGRSFYDLLCWYVARYNGALSFDHATRKYTLAAAKSAAGEAKVVHKDDVERLTSVFAAQARSKIRVLDSYTEKPATKIVAGAQAAEGVFHDVVLRSSVAKDVDDRVTLETARLRVPPREIELSFARYPTVPMVPGSLVKLGASGGLPSGLSLPDQPMRVWRLQIDATALGESPDDVTGKPNAGYQVSFLARLEGKDDATLRLPPFATPHYPGYLEGKVVSEKGGDKDVTYQFYTDDDTKLDRYRIKVPLFADQIVEVPFEPVQGSGLLYAPAYRDARVLLALELDEARIERLLDWRPGGRVAAEGQGDHLLFGKSDTSKTSVLHDYQDDKPVFSIARTNDKDTAHVTIREGKLTIQVKEQKG
jgi:hypothetical protein